MPEFAWIPQKSKGLGFIDGVIHIPVIQHSYAFCHIHVQ